MAAVTVYNAARMKQIEDTTVTGGSVNGMGNLILAQRNGVQIDAGNLRGPQGIQGVVGPQGVQGIQGVKGDPLTWQANKTYAAGEQAITPLGEVVASKTARTSRPSFDSTELANWAGLDRVMRFINTGFSWGGSSAAWDAGVLSADTAADTASQRSTLVNPFASAGTLSGSLKMLEAGIYDFWWNNAPNAEPGNAGYRIVASGTWPGPLDAPNGVFGQGVHINGQPYWETHTYAIGVRVPQPNLEVRFTGIQTNGSTNIARIRAIKRASL